MGYRRQYPEELRPYHFTPFGNNLTRKGNHLAAVQYQAKTLAAATKFSHRTNGSALETPRGICYASAYASIAQTVNWRQLMEGASMFSSKRTSSLISALLILPGLALASTIATQTPNIIGVYPGELFTVTVVGRNFPVPIDSGGLDISWNSVLSLGPAGVTLDPIWVPPSTAGTVGTGSITGMFLFANVPPNQNPNPGTPFNIATIQFRAVLPGPRTGVVFPSENELNPFTGAGEIITGINFASDGGVQVLTPEPRSVMLVLAGFGALLALGYRRRVRCQ